MSDRTSLTLNSLSATFSIASHPGMLAFSTWGSISPRQTSACGSGMSCSPVISMCVAPWFTRPFSQQSRCRARRVLRCAAFADGGPRKSEREIDEACDVVHRQEGINVRQHGADACRARLEPLIAQQRVEPDELPAGFVQPFGFLGQPFAGV